MALRKEKMFINYWNEREAMNWLKNLTLDGDSFSDHEYDINNSLSNH